jgi:post-segregation antitoxin (ccd killing protein)
MNEDLAERARKLGVNVSAAARQGVTDAVRTALERSDREAYVKHPENVDSIWTAAEVWGHA